jgi:hypothetical protein
MEHGKDCRKGVENIDLSSIGILNKTLSDNHLDVFEGYVVKKSKNVFIDFKVFRNDRKH